MKLIYSIPILSQIEERVDIPPLDVALDQFDVNNANKEDTINEKHKRHEKKKAREGSQYNAYSYLPFVFL